VRSGFLAHGQSRGRRHRLRRGFQTLGVIRAENVEALFDYALAFASQPLPNGPRVAVITNAGGPGIMAADAAESIGLKMITPSEKAKTKMREFLPAAASVNNPVDVIGDAPPELYIESLKVLQEEDDIDAIVVVVTPQNMTQPLALAENLAATHNGKKPLLTTFMGGEAVAAAKERLMAAGIPNYASPDRAMAALKGMCDYAAWRRRPPRIVTRFPVNRRRVDRIIQMQIRSRQAQVGEVEAKEILRAYEFNILDGHLARNADDGRRGRRAHRLPGRAENFLAGHHPQIRFRWRSHQSGQRRAGAGRI